MPLTETCGNGTRQRYKEELLKSRNGGSCVNDPETEDCTVECQPVNLTTGFDGSFDFPLV